MEQEENEVKIITNEQHKNKGEKSEKNKKRKSKL